jgi:hypothetical protein
VFGAPAEAGGYEQEPHLPRDSPLFGQHGFDAAELAADLAQPVGEFVDGLWWQSHRVRFLIRGRTARRGGVSG